MGSGQAADGGSEGVTQEHRAISPQRHAEAGNQNSEVRIKTQATRAYFCILTSNF